jgi:hypothetical protein
MAISELFPVRARKGIACVGDAPLPDDMMAFQELGFLVSSCTVEDLKSTAYLAGLSAVVFTQNAEKPLQLVRNFEENVKRLLDYDCLVVVRNAQFGRPIVINIIDRLKLPSMGLTDDEQKGGGERMSSSGGDDRPPHVRVFDTGVKWRDIAQEIARYPSGKAPNFDLEIRAVDAKGEKTDFSEGPALLVRRAFADCAELDLVPMPGGLSGGQVYRAYAKLAAGHLHYFVKIGERNEIFDEYRNYEVDVHAYIPFHLGPNLERDRCCLGSDAGIIVGDFVDESESLRDCASDGRGASAIACLFTRTLQGWYREAKADDSSLAAGQLLDRFPNSIPDRRFHRASELGATKKLEELRELFARCKSTPVLSGLIHGDLHATNVLVRGNDAIVIDFAKHCVGPLVYDAASLEASLLVEGFDNDKREVPAWLDSIRPLYGDLRLRTAPQRVHPRDPSSWFYACVRQVRLYAREMECHDGQYAAALAVALLKKSCKDVKLNEDRRAAAYVLAETVLLNTFTPDDWCI